MDSLGEMEFCIAIELSTGVTLLPPQLAELGSTDAVERLIREKLGEATGPANERTDDVESGARDGASLRRRQADWIGRCASTAGASAAVAPRIRSTASTLRSTTT